MAVLGYDLLSDVGNDSLTKAILQILNNLSDRGIIEFSVLDETKGIAMFANGSIAILSDNESITGHVRQLCSYPFTVVYRTRTSTSQKEKVKEWLDNLGRELMAIDSFDIGENRTFKKFAVTQWSSMYQTTEDKAEDWAVSIQMLYQNEFDRF